MEKKSIVKEKAFEFALQIIKLSRFLQDKNEYIISKQILRSGTSIGANITEALAGQSTRDFSFKMSIASKESRETFYWLSLLHQSQLVRYDFSKEMERCKELIRLLTAIVKTTRNRNYGSIRTDQSNN